MDKWLECTILPGQFTGEYAVQGDLYDGSGFSLFATSEDLRFSTEPERGKPVKGWLKIRPLKRDDDLCLVLLPQPALENGQTVTVKADRVESA